MDLFKRHANLTVLLVVLFAQVVGLAVQVKRPTDHGPTRLVRVWGISLIAPPERAVVHTLAWARSVWRNYVYLRGLRVENQRLQEENLRLRLEGVRMAEDAGQARRLQALMKFKEAFIADTVAAQVIGSSGSETSRLVYIDKGSRDGLKPDMAVMSPAGVVGKIVLVSAHDAQVLEINDPSSGVGAMLENSRLQGILKGTPAGEIMVHYIMSDEKVERDELVVTSGGDRVFPKGLPIGRVVRVDPGPDTFLNIRVKPAARLDRLEEVLVITKVEEKQPELVPEAPLRAADILAQRLPGIPARPPDATASASPRPAPGNPPANGTAPNAAPNAAPTAAPVPKTAKPAPSPAGSTVAAAGTRTNSAPVAPVASKSPAPTASPARNNAAAPATSPTPRANAPRAAAKGSPSPGTSGSAGGSAGTGSTAAPAAKGVSKTATPDASRANGETKASSQ
jgi:rod shape-determining protein MreC